MKQTAVDYLYERLSTLYLFKDALLAQRALQEAKQIEKEQAMQDYDSGLFDGTMDNVNDRLYKNAEQYYKETFKSE